MAQGQMEYKVAPVAQTQIITTDDQEGVVEAYVSVTGIEDNVKDIIEPGAYAKTLAQRTPKGVWNHDWNSPVAKALVVKELVPGDEGLPETLANGDPWPSEAGALYVKMQFNMKTERGRTAYEDVVFFGKEQEFSIGYSVPTGGAIVDSKSGIRKIKTLDLFEFSPVLWGAASNARTKQDALVSVKALFDDDTEFLNEIKALLEAKSAEAPATDATPDEETKVDDEAQAEEETKTDEEEVEVPEVTDTEEKAAEDGTVETGATPDSSDDQADMVEDAKETVDEVLDDGDGLSADVVSALLQLADMIKDRLATPTEVQGPTESSEGKEHPDKDTGLRKALDDLIYDSDVDASRLDTIHTSVNDMEAAVKAGNTDVVVKSADNALDEIGWLLNNTPNIKQHEPLKVLASAIQAELESYRDNKKTEETAAPSEEESKVAITLDELNEMKSLLY